jgi:Tol biopolymer transport system component
MAVPHEAGWERGEKLLLLDGDKELKPLIEPGFVKDNPAVSPDGHWLAYESNESGRFERRRRVQSRQASSSSSISMKR